MEEMVKSSEYFNNHLRNRVDPGLLFLNHYLESIFSEPRFNIHRKKPLSPFQIWQSWPNEMKDVFLKYYESFEISKICKAFDYDISFL